MKRIDYETETMIAHAFDARQSDVIQYGDMTGPLDTDGHSVAVAWVGEDVAQPLRTNHRNNSDPTTEARMHVYHGSAVRRLTPEECEALQGFPRGYTAIPYRGKPAADGPRYKALGNSMAVPVMHWIGRRIEAVEQLEQSRPLESAA